MVLSDQCVCHELKLQCTVVGGSATDWTGSVFGFFYHGYIALRHSQFESTHGGTYEISYEHDGSRIVAHAINTTSDSDGYKYISQLTVQLDMNDILRVDGKTVKCLHDNGTYTATIGTYTINYTIGNGTIIKYVTSVKLRMMCTCIYRSLSTS